MTSPNSSPLKFKKKSGDISRQGKAVEQQELVIRSAPVGVKDLFITLVGPIRLQQHLQPIAAVSGSRDIGLTRNVRQVCVYIIVYMSSMCIYIYICVCVYSVCVHV